jgi:hypothetical protein
MISPSIRTGFAPLRLAIRMRRRPVCDEMRPDHGRKFMNQPALRVVLPLLLLTACATTSAEPVESGETDSPRRFIVMIEGRNFVFADEGRPARFGFSTTRDVVARNAPEAEEIAIRMVREDETLNESLLNQPNDPPRVTVTHHIEVESFESVPRPDLGYIFYRDRDSK